MYCCNKNKRRFQSVQYGYSFIHIEHLYSASSRKLLRSAPNTSTVKNTLNLYFNSLLSVMHCPLLSSSVWPSSKTDRSFCGDSRSELPPLAPHYFGCPPTLENPVFAG